MPVGKATSSELNVTHKDRRWIDCVRKEQAATSNWNERWGFLIGRERRSGEASTSSIGSPVSKETVKLPKLRVPPQDTSNPFPVFPKVTSHEVGWRSRKEHILEIYGRESRPRYSIIRQLKWPHDAIP